MWEVCQSEFNISLDTFLFEYTIPQLTMLIQARLERDDAQDEKSKNKKPTGTMDDMNEIMRGF